MDLGEYDALTFDCYGTLIDWERGILDALHPWLRRHALDLPRPRLLEEFAESETRRRPPRPPSPIPRSWRRCWGILPATMVLA